MPTASAATAPTCANSTVLGNFSKIGSTGGSSLTSNFVTGNLSILNSGPGMFTVGSNIVNGNLSFLNNKGASSVTFNTVGGILGCLFNTPAPASSNSRRSRRASAAAEGPRRESSRKTEGRSRDRPSCSGHCSGPVLHPELTDAVFLAKRRDAGEVGLDAVLRCDLRDPLEVGRAATRQHPGHVLEIVVEAAGPAELDEAGGCIGVVEDRVRDAFRLVCSVARLEAVHLAGEVKRQLALEYVRRLVLVHVRVDGASILPGGRCTFSIEIDPPVAFEARSAGRPSAVFAASSFSSAVLSSAQNESRSASSSGMPQNS